MEDNFLDPKFSIPPDERGQAQNTETAVTTEVTETTTQTDTGQSQTTENTVPDKFFEDFNQRFSTSFKADEEVKNVLGLQQKIAEYETKAKLSDDYAKRIEDQEKQLNDYKNNGNSEFLSKPLIRQAYVAQQLLEKYPDKDPETLRQIVMSDVDKMGDLDVLAKSQKINHPRLAESDIKAVLYKKYGVDSETNPTEWDSIAKTEIAMDAESARATIKALTNGIELPKAVTKEERLAQESQNLQKRIESTTPLKAEFMAFDKFKDGDFEFDVPNDYKSNLGNTFDAMFIQNGMEATKENLQTAIELRDAMFLKQNFQKIMEVAVKKGQTEIQKKLDEALHNTQPPNTATATDEGDQTGTRPGLSKFLEDNR
jgi:hypothetical protein